MEINRIFIYPTDTIYGIGCNAENRRLVEKLRMIKKRDSKPFSVIAPSKEWILKHFKVGEELIGKYLPGPYTLLLEKKDKKFLSWVSSNKLIGVRIPKCDFTEKLQSTGKPIITTSVNISEEPFAKKIEDVKKEILENVDEIFDVGEISGKPSTLIKDRKEFKR